jgi:hypothetical protein
MLCIEHASDRYQYFYNVTKLGVSRTENICTCTCPDAQCDKIASPSGKSLASVLDRNNALAFCFRSADQKKDDATFDVVITVAL